MMPSVSQLKIKDELSIDKTETIDDSCPCNLARGCSKYMFHTKI